MKKTILASLLAMGISAPLLAQAGDLTLHNNTKQDATSIINNGPCSYPMLGEKYGITKAGETDVIPGATLNQACTSDKAHCKADVYMTNHCNTNDSSAKVVATIYINTTSGIITNDSKYNPKVYNTAYALTVNGPFEVSISGGTN